MILKQTLAYLKTQKSVKKMRSAEDRNQRLQLQLQQDLKKQLHTYLSENPNVAKVELYVDVPDTFYSMLKNSPEFDNAYTYSQVMGTDAHVYLFSEKYVNFDDF